MSYWQDLEKEIQAKELSDRLNGVKQVYKVTKKRNLETVTSKKNWDKESEDKLKLIALKYRKFR